LGRDAANELLWLLLQKESKKFNLQTALSAILRQTLESNYEISNDRLNQTAQKYLPVSSQ
jgi:hypothetical protein